MSHHPKGVSESAADSAVNGGRRHRAVNAKALFLVLRGAISLGAIVYLASALDWMLLRRIAGQVRPGFLLIAPPLLLVSYAWGGLRWSVLLERFGVTLRWLDGFVLYLIGAFYNVLLPGMLGGDVIRVGLCAARCRQPVAEVATTALMERAFGLLAILLIGTCAMAMLDSPDRSQLGPVIGVVMPLLALGGLAALAVIWTALRTVPTHWFARTGGNRFVRAGGRIAARLRQLSPRTMLLALILSVLCQAPVFLSASMLGRALGVDLPVLAYFAVMPVVVISTMLPISLGGLGVREGVLTLLLVRAGAQTGDAVALAFLIYVTYALTGLGGAVAQVVWRASAARDRQTWQPRTPQTLLEPNP